MTSAQVTVINERGVHARAAAKIVQCAHEYESAISLAKDNEAADAGSITEILMLAAAKDTVLTITVEGPDEEDALTELRRLFEGKFGEEA